MKGKAMDVNKVTLIGRLTDKPQSRNLPSGQRLASFSVATNYVWRDYKSKQKKDKTEFHAVIAWGKLADIVLTYLEKGSRIYLEGRLQYRKWKTTSGDPRKSCDIIADELIMLGHLGKGKSGKTAEALVKEEPSEKELVMEEV